MSLQSIVLAGLAVLVATTVALAEHIPSSTAAARATPPPGVTASSVTVAGLGDSSSYGEAQIGARAVFDDVNRAGGIYGRRITFDGSTDDRGDPATDAAAGRRLVQRRQALAVVPAITPTFAAAAILARGHIPSFGWGISTGFCDNPYAFAITGCIVPPGPVHVASSAWGGLLTRLFRARGQGGPKTAAVIGEAGDTGRRGVQVVSASAKAAGIRVVYQQAIVPTPPAVVGDYSPFVNAVTASNGGKPPDAVFLVLSFSNAVAVAKRLTQANYPGVITSAGSYDPALLAATNHQIVLTQFSVPESAVYTPQILAVATKIGQVASGTAVDQAMLAGYFSADFFVKALKKAGRNPTPDSLAKAASTLTYQIPNVVGPTSYPAARQYGTPCGSLVQSDGSTYQVAVPYGCFTNVDVTTLKPIRPR